MILWILAISTVVWCDDQPKIDPTTRIQKHEIGKAVIFDRIGWGNLELPFEKVFESDAELAWNSVYDDCEAAGISYGDGGLTDWNNFVQRSSLQLVFGLKKLFYQPQVSSFVFDIGLVKQALKKMWNFTNKQEKYLQSLVTLKPIHCFSSNKTIVFNMTYPSIKHLGHIMETWDAGDSFVDIQKYTYLNMPFHLIKANDSYFTYNKNSCNATDNFLICQMKDVELLEKCHPDNIKDCYRSVIDLKGSTYIRQLKYFYLVSSPLNEFTRNSSNSSIKVKITPQILSYIKLGPNETLVFEDRSDVYDVSDDKPFFMAQFHYNRSSELEKFAHYVEEQLVTGYIYKLNHNEESKWKTIGNMLLFILVIDFILICIIYSTLITLTPFSLRDLSASVLTWLSITPSNARTHQPIVDGSPQLVLNASIVAAIRSRPRHSFPISCQRVGDVTYTCNVCLVEESTSPVVCRYCYQVIGCEDCLTNCFDNGILTCPLCRANFRSLEEDTNVLSKQCLLCNVDKAVSPVICKLCVHQVGCRTCLNVLWNITKKYKAVSCPTCRHLLALKI